MSEGLIVVDCCGLVLSINGLAKKVFDVRGDDYQNHNILRLNRSVAMQNVVETALEGHDGEGMFQRNGRTYQLLSNPVYVEEKQRGVIILLLDVTEKEAAERQRREFTANVSHEAEDAASVDLRLCGDSAERNGEYGGCSPVLRADL